MPLTPIPVITIDGPTASGKGTVAHLVAVRLGFHYLDSGALYRLTALSAMRKHVEPNDEHGLAKAAAGLNCHFKGEHVFLSNEDVTAAIRAEAVGKFASCIATLPTVRQALYALQLGFRSPPGLVADGRDMGTVIFPRATLKVFLTATAEARAERRFKQLIGKGMSATLHDLQKDLNERDERDASRIIAPLRPAEDAHLLETSNMTAEDAVAQVLAWYAAARKREDAHPAAK